MHLYRMYWRRTLRKPGSITLWLLLPFLFMGIYSAAFGGDSNVVPKTGMAILDMDSSLVSGLVAGAFGQGPLENLIEIREVPDMSAMEALFADEKASAGLVIPKNFGPNILKQEPVTLKLYKNPRHFIGPQIAEGVVNTLAVMGNGLLGIFTEPIKAFSNQINSDQEPSADDVGDMAKSFYTIGSNAPNFAAITSIDVTIEAGTEKEDKTAGYNMASLFFPGLIMFGLLSVSLSIETRFLYDRLHKVTHRLVTAPVRPAAVVLQQRLYAASFLYVVGLVSALLGGLIWRIPPNGLAVANVITIALVLFIVGMNGTIFALSRSVKATSAISSAVMMVLLIVGGGFFPAEFTPEGFQSISRLTPTGIANMGLTQALTGRALAISLPALFAYSAAFFLMSVVVGRRRLI